MGRNPLYTAAHSGQVEVVKMLIALNANVEYKNKVSRISKRRVGKKKRLTFFFSVVVLHFMLVVTWMLQQFY